MVIQKIKIHVRQLTATVFAERLDPGGAAAAVFLGIFIGIVPIYGFQTLAAVGLALTFKLNKPLTVASTFISNPLLLPLLVVSSLETGFFLRHGTLHHGTFRPFSGTGMSHADLKDGLVSWVVGSLVLGIVVGAVGAAIAAAIVHFYEPSNPGLRNRIRFVNETFQGCDSRDRYFIWWKLRLDRIFRILATSQDLGAGTIVDLGCSYGIALSFMNASERDRRLIGCDLNHRNIAVARQALQSLNAEVSVNDVRTFPLPPAGLILMLDVLQYLSAEEQLALLTRCCAALDPNGVLIFRAHDRERGLWSTLTLALDKLFFSVDRRGNFPITLSAVQYQQVLENAGMQVEMQRFLNRLPLSHILFVAKKPALEITSC